MAPESKQLPFGNTTGSVGLLYLVAFRRSTAHNSLSNTYDSGPDADVKVMHPMTRLVIMVKVMVDMLMVAFPRQNTNLMLLLLPVSNLKLV